MNTDPFILNPLLAKIRTEFEKADLHEKNMNPDPMLQFQEWLQHAFSKGNPLANAMTLSTAGEDGMPSSRIMLLRDLSFGGFTFFTNYKSEKGRMLEYNPKASLLFFWPELERQVRIQGDIKKLPAAESDTYFKSRPFESKVGAWASDQSQVIGNRQLLDNSFEELKTKFSDGIVPRPPYWGGYVLEPVVLEFWQGRTGRLHDRLRYRLTENRRWKMERLMP